MPAAFVPAPAGPVISTSGFFLSMVTVMLHEAGFPLPESSVAVAVNTFDTEVGSDGVPYRLFSAV